MWKYVYGFSTSAIAVLCFE